jgi:3'-phosphoadenosine 5'-phosphosulfate sulfotransferase (PAPS reductase)/FAD synthetase
LAAAVYYSVCGYYGRFGECMTQQTNLFGEVVPMTPVEILEHAPTKPCRETAVLLAFSGGNDSRTLAHVVKPWFENSPYRLELAAIDTELSKDGWHDEVRAFADFIDLPLKFWKGEGFAYYKQFVEEKGFPGNAKHGEVQNRLKGRAFRKMIYARRSDTEGKMKGNGVGVWILSGVRKYESKKRMLLKSPYSWREGAQFINPLFNWQNHQVLDYMIEHDIPFAPMIQMDCGCGATVKDPDHEWAEIEQKCPKLCSKIQGISNPMPWDWGKFDPKLHAILSRTDQSQMWFDDGTIESYPVCLGCERDARADEMDGLENWG